MGAFMENYICPICKITMDRDLVAFLEHTNIHVIDAKKDHIATIRSKALKKFSSAFGLMTIIPLLICIYLVIVRFSSIDILIGLSGAYFLFAIVVALLGLLFGRRIIRDAVQKLAESTIEWERLAAEADNLRKGGHSPEGVLARQKIETRIPFS